MASGRGELLRRALRGNTAIREKIITTIRRRDLLARRPPLVAAAACGVAPSGYPSREPSNEVSNKLSRKVSNKVSNKGVTALDGPIPGRRVRCSTRKISSARRAPSAFASWRGRRLSATRQRRILKPGGVFLAWLMPRSARSVLNTTVLTINSIVSHGFSPAPGSPRCWSSLADCFRRTPTPDI